MVERKNGFLYLYLGAIPEDGELPEVVSPARGAYLSGLSHPRRKRESAYTWLLLEQAVRERLGLSASEIDFRRLPSGRWVAPDFCFSLSHSGGVCAVAISSSEVGVDIEEIKAPRSESLPRRILGQQEYSEYETKDSTGRVEFFIRKWTEREACFKLRGEGSAARVGDSCQPLKTLCVTDGVVRYYLTLSSELSDIAEITYTVKTIVGDFL